MKPSLRTSIPQTLAPVLLLLLALLVAGPRSRLAAQHAESRNTGLSRQLNGVVANVYTFAYTADQPPWTHEDRALMLTVMASGQEWLTEQGARYGRDVRYVDLPYGPDEGIRLPVGIEPGEVGPAAFAEGFSVDVTEFARVVYAIEMDDDDDHYVSSVDAIQHVVFLRGPGRCYAHSTLNPNVALETAVIYEENSMGGATLPVAYSHETLHLYGAWDLYLADSQTGAAVTLAEHILPKSVMAHSYQPGVEVDQVTAWLVGWNDEPRWWYEALEPRGDDLAAVREGCRHAGQAVREALAPAAEQAGETGRRLLEQAGDQLRTWWNEW